MRFSSHRRLIGALAAFSVTMAVPALAQNADVPRFTLDKRAVARSADRYGDLPLGAVIRTDERYGSDNVFQGPRGWDYMAFLRPTGRSTPAPAAAGRCAW
jgi:hypothetical protein